jgi:hypothetical protein
MSRRVLSVMLALFAITGCHVPKSGVGRTMLGVGVANIVGGSALIALPDMACEPDEMSEHRAGCYVFNHLDAVGVFMIALGSGNIAMAYGLHDASGPPKDAAGAMRYYASSGRCQEVAIRYRELRDHDVAAAAELAFDDDVRTCLIVQDARERGLIR